MGTRHGSTPVSTDRSRSPDPSLIPSSVRRLSLDTGGRSADGSYVVILPNLLHVNSSQLLPFLPSPPVPRYMSLHGSTVYTAPSVCDYFLILISNAGIDWMERTEATNDPHMPVWKGTMKVSGLDISDLGMRKGMCRWWVGRWRSCHPA
jgi:nicotinamide N-methyltransferase